MFDFVKRWTVLRLRRRLCKGGHLAKELTSREGMWLNETEPLDWNNYRCNFCGAEFFQYVNSSGDPVGREINR